MISQTHKLDVVPGGVTAVVHVKQYQTGESLVFELFSRFGDFEISAAFTECTVRGTKSDGNGYSANATCDPSNNSVTVQLTEQMTAVAGRQPYEITITESTGRMITTTFILDVHRAALDADTVESESVIKEVQTIVEEYIEENPGLFVVDPTLTQSGEAADAKVTGDEIADLKSAISGGVGIPADVKEALLNCFENVAWINDDGQDYYDALEAALYPPADLVSISAVYTQSGTVYNTDSLNDLKTDLVVTANYSDQTTAIVDTYTLSGTLTVGTSTITVSYGGKTTTFTVTVTERTLGVLLYNYDFTQSLVDSVNGVTAVINSNVSRDSSGVHFNAQNAYVTLSSGKVDMRDKSVLITVSASPSSSPGSEHGRLFAMAAHETYSNTSAAAFLWRFNNGFGWNLYTGSAWNTSIDTTLYPVNFFTGKQIKLYFDNDGYCTISYGDAGGYTFTEISTYSSPVASTYVNDCYLLMGSSMSDNLTGFAVSAVQIYEGDV